jgi:hypothetical protein
VQSEALKENKCQPRLLYPAKPFFIIEGEIKTFHYKQEVNQFTTTKPGLQKILKGILYPEEEEKCNYKNTGKNKYQ